MKQLICLNIDPSVGEDLMGSKCPGSRFEKKLKWTSIAKQSSRIACLWMKLYKRRTRFSRGQRDVYEWRRRRVSSNCPVACRSCPCNRSRKTRLISFAEIPLIRAIVLYKIRLPSEELHLKSCNNRLSCHLGLTRSTSSFKSSRTCSLLL
jgi:hypothetical protein